MKKRVVVIGGGISGLIAAAVIQKSWKAEVILLESTAFGGEWLIGGIKYMRATERMVEFLDELQVVYSDYSARGGILLRGNVKPYPKALSGMRRDQIQRIRGDYYRKTRRQEPDIHARKAFNDPAALGARRAIRCEPVELVRRLAAKLTAYRATVKEICPDAVKITTGASIPYDFLVIATPFYEFFEAAHFYVPQAAVVRKHIAIVHPRRHRYAKWDFVYTPYTPASSIHRLSHAGPNLMAESAGAFDRTALATDLNFLFDEGYFVVSAKEDLKGHILASDERPEWPENIAPVGPYAKWDMEATADVSIDDAEALRKRWFGSD